MARTKNTTTTSEDRKTHSWSEDQLRYLAENPSTPRGELVAGFRKRWPDANVSEVGIQGRRYRILRDGSSRHPEIGGTALQARVEELKQQLAEAEAALGAYEDKQTSETPRVTIDSPMDEIRRVARELGLKASGKKADLVKAINAA